MRWCHGRMTEERRRDPLALAEATMKCNKCNRNIEAKYLRDCQHYECKCGERWDTDLAPIMEQAGQLFGRVERRACVHGSLVSN